MGISIVSHVYQLFLTLKGCSGLDTQRMSGKRIPMKMLYNAISGKRPAGKSKRTWFVAVKHKRLVKKSSG